MVVPYGDPAPPVKCAFDAGEDGFGKNANSLVRRAGADACRRPAARTDVMPILPRHPTPTNVENQLRLPGPHPLLRRAPGPGRRGVRDHRAGRLHARRCAWSWINPLAFARTVVAPLTTPCVPEDVGLAWKHTDWRTGQGEVRRARKLVVQVGGRPHWQPSAVAFTACRCPSSFQFICTVANYDYAFSFDLFLDGTIALNVKVRVDECEGRTYDRLQPLTAAKACPPFSLAADGCVEHGCAVPR
jgi:hypothetical protein